DRDRIDARKQWLEYADGILRAADQIAEDDTAGGGDRERDRELEQSDAQVADELEGRQHIDKLVENPDRIRKEGPADLPIGRAYVPEANECDDEGSLNQTASEPATVALRVLLRGALARGTRRDSAHDLPSPPAARSLATDCSMALRISSCSSANSVLRRLVNFSDVMKPGLRGCGSSIVITSLMGPGRAENTPTRSARKTASPRLWGTNTMGFPVRESSTERSSPGTMRVWSSRAP